jgi:anti-sigma B factor antagonist
MPQPAQVVPFDGGVVIALAGELDAYDAPALRTMFQEAVATARPPIVVVDLTSVSFLDSTVLGALVGLLRRVREYGGELRAVLPDSPARRIFEVTALDKAFIVRPSRAAAISDDAGTSPAA